MENETNELSAIHFESRIDLGELQQSMVSKTFPEFSSSVVLHRLFEKVNSSLLR